MLISEFNYNLPPELVATHPLEPRDAAGMLVMDRDSGKLDDKHFYDLPDILQQGDVLVFNDSKVIPARLQATSSPLVIPAKAGIQSSRHFEVLLIKNLEGSIWECWLKPGKKAKIGDNFIFSDKLSATLLRREEDLFIFKFNLAGTEFYAEIGKIGEMPIPPYIQKARSNHTSLRGTKQSLSTQEIASSQAPRNDDRNDYQTIYAKTEGSVAAPTAGLHFTEELLQKLRNKSVQLEYVMLHVGLGTFQPVTTENVEDFQIHSEYYEISAETAERLNKAKDEGRRIIAVGTTSVRVLESASSVIPAKAGIQTLKTLNGDTTIYIYPGYKYQFVDGIITNFHIPGSSLLLLVSAFAGKEQVLAAYVHAVEVGYRFYSYGDGMFIS